MKFNAYDVGFYGLFLVIVVAFFFVVKPYLLLFLLAFCTAITIMPVYEWLQKKIKISGIAAILTTFLFLTMIIAPVGFFAVIAVEQAQQLSVAVQNFLTNQPDKIVKIENYINSFLPTDIITDSLKMVVQALSDFVQKSAVPFVGSAVNLVVNAVFFVVLLVIILIQKQTIVKSVTEALPMNSTDAKQVSSSIISTIGPIMRSTVIVSFVQALLGIFILGVFGTPSLIFFFFALFFASFIPLGSGLVIIPVGIVYLLLGNYVAGISIILWHAFVTSSSDNIVRSWLFKGGNTQLPELLTLIATLGGLVSFGILGIIFGPLLAVVFLTFYRLYLSKKTHWG